jgi:hypothetical protein
MKYNSFFVILLLMSVFSCDNSYHFEKIKGTKHILYKAGAIEGVLFQNKKEKDFLTFTESNYPLLEKYLKEFDSIINAWFKEDKNNLKAKRGWELVRGDELFRNQLRLFLSSFAKNFIDNYERYNNLASEEIDKLIKNVANENVDKFKSIY